MKTAKKIWKLIIYTAITISIVGLMFGAEKYKSCVIGSILGTILGLILPATLKALQDIGDTSNWKVSQRQLLRGGTINKNTLIRISFAYLYRIKVGNKYFLIKNARNTGKFQPVGGVYKFRDTEKLKLKNIFHVVDDNKIPIDDSSRDDYRLRIQNQYLRKFVRYFDKKAQRENTENLIREFKEELLDSGLLHWDSIRYRVCGRHMTMLEYSQHFDIYELLLADIIELLPTKKQEEDLLELEKKPSELYRFVSSDEINTLGVNTDVGCLTETISTHSYKILQETEDTLMRLPDSGVVYTRDI